MDRLSAPGYDLFKLVVALILTLLLAILLLRGCNPVPPAPVADMDTPDVEVVKASSPVPATEEPAQEPSLPAPITATVMTPTPTVTASPEQPPAPLTDTPAPLPVTDTPTPAPWTDTPPPVPVTDTPTPAPVTETPTPAPAPAPGAACNTSLPSRLSAGQRARTLVNLNMRNGPDIKASILQTNRAGTQVEIIGGPQCNPQGERAYLWWQIRLGNGKEGWSAETPLIQKGYFLEAIP